MVDLVSKYGPEWFSNKFNGSFFMYDGVPARVRGARRTSTSRAKKTTYAVDVSLCPRVDGQVKSVRHAIPSEYFDDSSMFNVPELGYRHTADGKWLAFLRRNNSSYVRGLSMRNLSIYESPFTRYLRTVGVNVGFLDEDTTANLVMQPTFIPLHTGIKLMLEGKLLSFAASPTVAVVPSKDESAELSILMCDNEIGTVDSNGTMDISLSTARNYVEETLCQ